MDSEDVFLHQTEQLITGMMSFLDDTSDDVQEQKSEEETNPLCWAIKRIINVFPESSAASEFDCSQQERKPLSKLNDNCWRENQIEKACRYKDPYMQEVNRLMTSTAVGHPLEGSPENYQAAENYALFGKEFLDFPTDLKFSQPLDVASYGDMPTSLMKLPSSPMVGMQAGNRPKQLITPRGQQQQIFVNQTNYCSYPLFQTQNLVQPLSYSNPFLMSQYFNAILKESQMNASLVQQQLLTGAGIQERWLYAQMLQHQMQANQTALMNSYFGSGAGCNTVKCKLETVKAGTTFEPGATSLKPNFDEGGVCENPTLEQ